MQIVRTIRARRSAIAIAQERSAYGPDWLGSPGITPAQHQLAAFNTHWAGYARRIPFYRDMVAKRAAPEKFENLDQFAELLPVIDKAAVREKCHDLTDPIRPIEKYRVTGGSTGEPTKMPCWADEFQTTLIDKWIGRSFYGVAPSDKLFTIWGHSHLLGKGFMGMVNAYKRRLKDYLLGTYRQSAYDLSPAANRAAADTLLSVQPDYMIAYSSALELFARVNEDRAADIHRLKLKLALATGEIFPTLDGPEVVSRILGCPMGMEYGSVETDILAHTDPAISSPKGPAGQGYRVFWRRYMIECEAPSATGERGILVTSLYPRCFPLIRYRIGDAVVLYDGDEPRCLTRVAAVAGRSNSFIQLSDGVRVHTMGVKHCVEGVPGVSRFQVIQNPSAPDGQARGIAELRVILLGAGAPDQEGPEANAARQTAEAAIREKAQKIHPELGRVPIRFNRTLIQTRAGKTPMIAEAEAPQNDPSREEPAVRV